MISELDDRPAPERADALPEERALVSGFAEMTLETTNLEQMEAFYGGVLGLSVLSRDSDRIWLALGERSRLGLWSPGRREFGDQGGRHVHFALSTTPRRLEALVARLSCAGIDVHGPIEHPGGDRSAYFEDPAGNVVEVWDFFHRGAGARSGVEALR